MQREVKIGLLAGLAFIIVMGILLSDSIQHSSEPPQAKLADAGKSVQQSVNTLGSTTAPPVTVITPQNVTPQQQVPTANDLNPHPQAPTQVVTIGPGTSNQQTPPVTIVQDQHKETAPTPAPVQPEPAPAPLAKVENRGKPSVGADSPDVVANAKGGLHEVARQAGEELVPVGPGNSGVAFAAGSAKTYKAEPGDTVSRMATKFFGSNSKAAREAIIKSNASLRDNPDKVIVGRTYTIPAESSPVSVASAVDAPAASKPLVAPGAAEPSSATLSSSEYWYTVKQGDSLWRIATEQVGNAGAVAAIKDLNKDVLKGNDVVKVDMKLKLPSRPIASAN